MISNFRRVLDIMSSLLGVSPASVFGMPTFRNNLYVPSSKAGYEVQELHNQPLKMEQIDGSETSACKNQTPGIHPNDYSQYSYLLLSNLSFHYSHALQCISTYCCYSAVTMFLFISNIFQISHYIPLQLLVWKIYFFCLV
jgi:hypothetical protein